MRKLFYVIYIFFLATSIYAIDYLGVHRQATVGNKRVYLFRLPMGACNEIVYDGASNEDLAKNYCVLRYNTQSKKAQQKRFFDTFTEANDYFVSKAKLEGKNVKKNFHGNAHKWSSCDQ